MPSVLNVIKRTGLELKERYTGQCTGTYSGIMRVFTDEELIQLVKPHQKISQFPGSILSYRNKTEIWLALKDLHERFGEEEFKFVPNTFLWPQEKEALQKVFQESPLWIYKPWMVRRKYGIQQKLAYKMKPDLLLDAPKQSTSTLNYCLG